MSKVYATDVGQSSNAANSPVGTVSVEPFMIVLQYSNVAKLVNQMS